MFCNCFGSMCYNTCTTLDENSDAGDDDGVEEADDDALQTSNKYEFICVILSDSSIYNFIIKCILKHALFLFLTGLYDLLGVTNPLISQKLFILRY